jgi:superfamily II DNA helicase RecQ
VDAAAAATGEPRGRIIAAMSFLEEKGDLTLRIAGARQGYRRLKPLVDGRALSEKLHARFSEREHRDVARVSALLKMAEYPGCWSRYLASYFGDPPAGDCGHCGWCLWQRPGALHSAVEHNLGLVERQLVHTLQSLRESALGSPRQMTRFLCGLSSPATSKAKLTRRPEFGRLASVPFAAVLAFVAAFLWRRRTDSLANNPRLRRQRQVAQIIRAGTQELQQLAAQNDSEKFFANLFRLLQEQLGERLDAPATAITEAVVEDKLRPRGVPDATLAQIHELFQSCNLARYAPTSSGEKLAALIPKFENVTREIQGVKL